MTTPLPFTLTPDEEKLILQHRAQQAEKEHKLSLCYTCIDELKRWKDWSAANGRGLTFSTFVDGFKRGLAPTHNFTHQQVYEGIKAMIDALDRLHG